MIRSACVTDRGLVREVNEDSMLCLEEVGFFMLADGVGGHNSGEIASNLAVELAKEYIENKPINKLKSSEVFTYLFECLKEINEKICESANRRENCLGMATTAIILVVKESRAYIANVGDSRAYILKNKTFERVTEDHTYVNELLKNGQISQDEAMVHPKRNVITRALGVEEPISPDFYNIELKKGYRILLCTDGLYNEVDEETIGRYMVKEKKVNKLVGKLVKLACENGGADNITVSCIDILK